MWISTVERSRSMDLRAETEFGIPTATLMERAGLAVFAAIAEMVPEGGRLAVVCGRGNNGGDGFVAARAAHDRGYRVDCLVSCASGDLAPLALEMMKAAQSAGVPVSFVNDAKWKKGLDSLGQVDLIVDGLLGTGARSHVKGAVQEAILAINHSCAPVLSIDVPSGIDGDTGEELGESVWALRTIVMGTPKPFLFQGIGLEHAGHWQVADIGFPNTLLEEPTGSMLIDRAWAAEVLPERMKQAHKGDSGGVLVVAGSSPMPGAAMMAVRSALRAGAGLVTIAATADVCSAVVHQIPEALTMPLPALPDGSVSPAAAALLIAAQGHVTAAVFGPGMSQAPSIKELLAATWADWKLPAVIDADALNAIAGGHLSLPTGDVVLTPHPGEMGRLMNMSTAEVQSDRFKVAAAAAEKFSCSVLLKGPYTLVSEKGRPTLVNQTGNSGMATGGMGDVLSGVIGTLLAQELPPSFAAAVGAHWHGLAGDLCAEEIGPVGYFATEVADHLPLARVRIVSS